MCRADRGLQIAAQLMVDVVGERRRERVRGFTNQERLLDPPEQWPQGLDTAGFRQTPGNPVDPVITGQRLGRGLGVGGLAVVHEGDTIDRRNRLHAVSQTRKARQRLGDRRVGHTHGRHGGEGAGRVLPVVRAAQAVDATEVGDLLAIAKDRPVDRGIADRGNPADRHLDDAATGGAHVGGNAGARRIVDADDERGVRRRHLQQPALRRDIAVHRAMAVEVVGGNVKQDHDLRPQAARQIDLIGRHLKHIDAVGGERLEVQHRRAEIAAHLHRAAGRRQ